MSLNILGIIPARGGSKGVKRKNIRIVGGKPLIAYTIEAAQLSNNLSCCVVSTDDEEIALLSSDHGATVKIRPKELAQDDTPMLPVLKHVVAEMEQQEHVSFDYCLILQPTTPLRTSNDINEAIKILIETNADSVISVYRVFDHHPTRMYLMQNNRLIPYTHEPASQLRQELPPVYHRNGAIYAFKRELLHVDSFMGQHIVPYIMPYERSLNIDEEFDLQIAELLFLKQDAKNKSRVTD